MIFTNCRNPKDAQTIDKIKIDAPTTEKLILEGESQCVSEFRTNDQEDSSCMVFIVDL